MNHRRLICSVGAAGIRKTISTLSVKKLSDFLKKVRSIMPTMPTIPVMEDFSFKGLLKECGSICIPEIQRDYAQGRDNEKVCEIREGFINALIPVLLEGRRTLTSILFTVTKETVHSNPWTVSSG